MIPVVYVWRLVICRYWGVFCINNFALGLSDIFSKALAVSTDLVKTPFVAYRARYEPLLPRYDLHICSQLPQHDIDTNCDVQQSSEFILHVSLLSSARVRGLDLESWMLEYEMVGLVYEMERRGRVGHVINPTRSATCNKCLFTRFTDLVSCVLFGVARCPAFVVRRRFWPHICV